MKFNRFIDLNLKFIAKFISFIINKYFLLIIYDLFAI